MAYDERLDQDISAIVAGWGNVDRKRMFGGVCHLLDGNMFAGVLGASLILRLGPEEGGKALAVRSVRPFDLTGRPMKGWVVVDPPAIGGETGLRAWLERAHAYAKTLPAK